MCGIAGIFSPKGIEVNDLTLMSTALQHRGPDGYGYMLFSEEQGIRVVVKGGISDCRPNHESLGFAHRRLSIIDLSEASLQPMKDESNTYCVTYNGELYNYLDLKADLQASGYSFRTTGDAEVLLRAYEAWGPECMQRFNGMWAFALLDKRNQSLIFSRDRFGIKPLYYMIQHNTLYFASEIKGLLAIPSLSPKPNKRTAAKYLLTGLIDDTEETFFEGVFQFPAAHWARISLNDKHLAIRPEPYWSLPTFKYQGTEQDAVKKFKELFFDSVKIHAQSDVPVGTCLSGGLDSSSIVCTSELLRKSYQIPNYTHSAFGYCPSEENYSEKKYMDVVVRATSVEMNNIDFTQEQFGKTLPLILQAQDEPFSSASVVAQWFVFQRAKQNGMTVMLDGQGADEILAGYHTYFITMALNLFTKGHFPKYLSLRSKYEKEIGKFPLTYRWLVLGTFFYLISHLLPNLLQPTEYVYKKFRQMKSMTPEKLSLTRELVSQYFEDKFAYKYKRLNSLGEELRAHLQSTSLPGLLRYEDRNSMAHSIEARVPFLDYRLVEFLFTLPDDLKIKGVTTKYILREAMEGILPETIRNRKDKIGFKPNPDLTFAFVRGCMDSLRGNDTEYEKLWFEEKGVEKIIKSQNRSVSFEFLLWRILNMKLWIRQHWNGR